MHEDTFESGNGNVQISDTTFSSKNNDSLLIDVRQVFPCASDSSIARETL